MNKPQQWPIRTCRCGHSNSLHAGWTGECAYLYNASHGGKERCGCTGFARPAIGQEQQEETDSENI